LRTVEITTTTDFVVWTTDFHLTQTLIFGDAPGLRFTLEGIIDQRLTLIPPSREQLLTMLPNGPDVIPFLLAQTAATEDQIYVLLRAGAERIQAYTSDANPEQRAADLGEALDRHYSAFFEYEGLEEIEYIPPPPGPAPVFLLLRMRSSREANAFMSAYRSNAPSMRTIVELTAYGRRPHVLRLDPSLFHLLPIPFLTERLAPVYPAPQQRGAHPGQRLQPGAAGSPPAAAMPAAPTPRVVTNFLGEQVEVDEDQQVVDWSTSRPLSQAERRRERRSQRDPNHPGQKDTAWTKLNQPSQGSGGAPNPRSEARAPLTEAQLIAEAARNVDQWDREHAARRAARALQGPQTLMIPTIPPPPLVLQVNPQQAVGLGGGGPAPMISPARATGGGGSADGPVSLCVGSQAPAGQPNRKRNLDEGDDSSPTDEEPIWAVVERLRNSVAPGERPPNSDNPKVRWSLSPDGSGQWIPSPDSEDEDVDRRGVP
jgi:hypothetical protein